MKKAYFLLILLFSLTSVFAQEKIDVTIAGIDAKVEKAMLPGDVISYWTGENGDGHQNLRIRVSGENGKDVFFSSLDTKPDANGHYDFDHKITITDGEKFSFDEELELLVYIETIFGNTIWTKVTRNKSNLSDPIVLDKYTKQQNRTTPPMRRFILTYFFTGGENDIEEKVKANEDGWANRQISDFRFMLKNSGQSAWKIDKVFDKGQNVYSRKARVVIPWQGLSPILLNQKIVIRIEMTTEKGNLMWHEEEIEARELRKLFYSTQYTIKGDEETNATPTTDNTTSTDNNNQSTSPNNIQTDKPNGKEEPGNGSTKPDLNASKPDNPTLNSTDTKPIGTVENTGATDLTTPTLRADCSDRTKGDTLVTLNGSTVCVKKVKAEGSRNIVGKLGLDCNFKIGSTVFPLKGGESIKFMKSTGTVAEGVLRADVIYPSSAGEITLKEGTVVAFSKDVVIGASLAKPTNLTIGGTTITCIANENAPFDVRFDNQGRLQDCAIEQEMKWSNGVELTFPAKSRLIFKSGNMTKVICYESSAFDLNGKTIHVKADNIASAYEFSSIDALEKVNAAAGNVVEIEGQSIPVQEGKEIKFAFENGAYSIEKFFTGSQVNVNVYKKDKKKETVVKEGKRIIIKGGKVVKAG